MDIYNKVMEKFTDAELIDVKLNERKEDKNDWFYEDFRQSKGARGKNERKPRKN